MRYLFLILLLGSLSIQLKAKQTPIDSLENLLNKELKGDTLRVQCLNRLAFYVRRSNLDKMWQYVHEADSISEAIKYRKGKAESLALKGMYFKYRYKLDTSFIFNTRALELYREIGDELHMAITHSSIAILFAMQQDFEKAIVFNDSARIIYEEKNDIRRLASVYVNLGAFYKKIGYYDKALENYQKAVVLYEKEEDPVNQAVLYANISRVYQDIKKYDKALVFINKCKNMQEDLGDKTGLANSYHLLGDIYSTIGNNDSAIYIWERGLDLANEIKDIKRIIILQKDAGAIYYSYKNDFAKSLSYLENANSMSKEYNYLEGQVISLYALAKVYKGEQNFKMAKKYAFECYNLLLDKKRFSLKANINNLVSEIYKIENNYKKAYEHHVFFNAYKDSVYNDETQNKLTELEYKFKYEQEKRVLELEQQRKDAENEAKLEKEKRTKQMILLIAFIVFIVTFGLTLIYRIHQKQKRTQLSQTKAEIENRLLRVQMNPHFMFNSLNSVQSYIASNQNELAEDYLARFAQLTRAILNNSREDFIRLDNEIETLKTYLELEQQRFSHTFEFAINIDEELDEEMLQVPPMLIQPFVENAIIHGVAPLKQNGEIKLSVKPNGNENSVLCIVEDNGVGREASAKINKGNKHKSLGLQVTKERFELIKQQTGVEVKIEIIDLSDGKGTKVEMVIPVQS